LHDVFSIDEMHTVVGAGAAEGSMDASNLLKPALARGQLRCIGATTINEYRKYIEKDKALERRFQQVQIDQPSPEDTVSILRGLKSRYELHHGVRIRDEALLAAAKLSHRYIPDRFLPDKAIDLMDEACAKLKNEITSKPTILDEIDRKIIQLEMERLSLKSDYENDEGSLKKDLALDESMRLEKIDQQLEELKEEQEELNLKWMAEKGGVGKIKEIKEKIGEVQFEIEKCEREFDLNRAAELKYSNLPQLEEELRKIEEISDQYEPEEGAERMVRDEVVADDIAAVVATWTGIPPQRLLETERDRILNMGENLKQRVVGQDEAIDVLTDAVQRSRAGLNDPTKPIASMIFLGPVSLLRAPRCIIQHLFLTLSIALNFRPASGKPSFARLWRSSCLTRKKHLSVSTCQSTWRSTQSRDSLELLQDTLVMMKVGSSRTPFAANLTLCSCLMRWKRLILMSSTSCFNC
jgi:ATP-dependent Clp protease ATP-binding subunit ClpB